MAPRIYHLEIEEPIIEEYWMGVHTPIEAYQLVYYINKNTSLLLCRSKTDLQNENNQGIFQLFEWENPEQDINCFLFSNKYQEEKVQTTTNNNTLFELPQRNEVSLFSEFKQVDFYIRCNDKNTLESLQRVLAAWSAISYTFRIPFEKIKNRLLIFDK